jgi:hypothetical protein
MQLNEGVTSKLTLGGLLNNYNKLYGSQVNCTVIKSDATEDKEKTAKTFTATLRSATGGVHQVIIKLGRDRSGAYTLSSPCKVDCNCPTYVFRNNELLHQNGAALYTRYTKKPTKTGREANPEHIVTCCKHIYGYISFLMRRGDMHR